MDREPVVVLHRSLTELEQLIPLWQGLMSRALGANAFNHPAFCVAWLQTIGQGSGIKPLVVCVYSGNKLVALAPLCLFSDAEVITGIGGEDFGDYHDWLIDAAFDPVQIIGQIVAHLALVAPGHAVILHRLDSSQASYFLAAHPACVVCEAGTSAYRIVWQQGLSLSEDYMLSAGGRKFHNDTLRRRRLLRQCCDHLFTWYEQSSKVPDSLVSFVHDTTKARYIRTGAPDLTTRPGFAMFLEKLLVATYSAGLGFAVAITTPGDELIAAQLGMAFQDKLYWVWPAFDRQLSCFSPGRLLVLETLLQAGQRGYSCLDFTWGDDPYKLDWSNLVVPLYSVSFQLALA